jgi:hypothetical protein
VVDKVDRPDGPASWHVQESAATHDREQGRGQEQEDDRPFYGDQDDEFSSPGSPAEWHKFHHTHETRKVLKIDRDQVKHIWFRRATMKRQLAVLEIDLELRNGRQYRAAQAILPRFDDYFRIKGYIPSQEVGVVELFHEPVIDLSIDVSPPRRPAKAPPPPVIKQITQKMPWWPWVLLGLAIIGAITILVMII